MRETESEKSLNQKEILDRLRELLNIESDTELAAFLGVKGSVVANWRSRGSVNLDSIVYRCQGMDLDYILFGKARVIDVVKTIDRGDICVVPLVSQMPPVSRLHFVNAPKNSFLYLNRSYITRFMEADPEALIAFVLMNQIPNADYKQGTVVFVDLSNTKVSSKEYADYLCIGELRIPTVARLIAEDHTTVSDKFDTDYSTVYRLDQGFEIVGRVVGQLQSAKPIPHNYKTGAIMWQP